MMHQKDVWTKLELAYFNVGKQPKKGELMFTVTTGAALLAGSRLESSFLHWRDGTASCEGA